jgi:hypothetical protein
MPTINAPQTTQVIVNSNGETITVTSSGTINTSATTSGTAGDAIYYTAGDVLASLNNAGLIEGGVSGVVDTTGIGNVTNTGTIEGVTNAGLNGLNSTGTLYNAGVIETPAASIGAIWGNGYATNTATGTISGGDYGFQMRYNDTFENDGLVQGGASFAGIALLGTAGDTLTLIFDPGSDLVNGISFTGTGNSDVNHLLLGGTSSTAVALSTLEGYVKGTNDFDHYGFANGADRVLDVTSSELLSGTTIDGFYGQNELVFTNESYVAGETATYVSGVVTILSGATSIASFTANEPSFTSGNHIFVTNVGGDVALTTDALCYLRGTMILTPDGERPVEALRIGDAVVTKFGGVQAIKWIGRQAYEARFIGNHKDKWPVCIAAGALGDGLPCRDLYVSPGHSMLCGGQLILARALVNGVTIRQNRPDRLVEYIQLEFAAHDCVQAEGVWSESFADGPGLRVQFHNQADFWVLYPDYQTPEALNLCAPRPEAGADLEEALRPVVALASAGRAVGALEGCVDQISESGIQGWALDTANKLLPVLLEIRLSGRRYATVLACDERDDLRAAGKGEGRCAFFFQAKLPVAYLPFLTVHRAADGAEILSTMDRQEQALAA